MMAQLLPPQPNSERISQLLPTVTCSSCSNPVPISELTDHVCSPMSSAPKTPPPLRHRQTPLGRPTQILPAGPGRIPTPSNATNARTPTPPAILRAQRPPLKPLHVQAPARSSSRAAAPLVSPGTKVPPKTSEAPSFRHLPPILSSNRSHSTSPRPLITRSNTPSNPNSSASSHHVLPPFASNVRSQNIIHRPDHSMPHSPNMGPYYPEENIDTSSGGEAGMAGVGRRGFAAVARAAMFSANYQGRAELPKFLDIDAASRVATETPPLSAGSSHSPGLTSPFPQTPLTPDARIPSPGLFPSGMPIIHSPATNVFSEVPGTPTGHSPLTRMPFFEKFKNKMPGANVMTGQDPNYETSDPYGNVPLPDTPTTAVPPDRAKGRPTNRNRSSSPPSEADSASRYTGSPPTRNPSLGSTSSRALREHHHRPGTPSSGSEGGLAYADSDHDDNDYRSRHGINVKQNAPAPVSILRSGSTASTAHIRFPSGESTSTTRTARIDAAAFYPKPVENVMRHRNNSASSVSSASSASGRQRINSAIVAQALGLSGTPPRDYGKLGGPGVTGFGERVGRSASISSRGSGRGSNVTGPRTRPSQNSEAGASMMRAKSTGSQASEDRDKKGSSSGPPPPSPGAKTQRSNTVQGPHSSPETRPPKLPTRSRTTPMPDRNDRDRDRTDKAGERRVRVKKPKVCAKCSKTIDDGRWVPCDGGTVLCDLCWKSMYLPKCRRCDMTIEKQAVSSSDGQLKGKYHRECFNCHVCHKPFPDRSFYVFDGKPLCAYHYHEANNSLCSATLCGQPIEGPCAVSHAGDRYHPEHFTCEYPKCREKLVEYWEVDGRMLCESHAAAYNSRGSDDWDNYYGGSAANAKKRVTRFIDLANGNGLEGSDLR